MITSRIGKTAAALPFSNETETDDIMNDLSHIVRAFLFEGKVNTDSFSDPALRLLIDLRTVRDRFGRSDLDLRKNVCWSLCQHGEWLMNHDDKDDKKRLVVLELVKEVQVLEQEKSELLRAGASAEMPGFYSKGVKILDESETAARERKAEEALFRAKMKASYLYRRVSQASDELLRETETILKKFEMNHRDVLKGILGEHGISETEWSGITERFRAIK